ncbi:MAG: ATP-binding cassette domain-containing protein [Deltaproteobacteria bacterium]|nr:ATP-binding cassette domain-containing protein [Deltaproteobacteria bacterium]
MQPLYQINNLQHHYNGLPALDIDRFSIQPGTITGIIGPNGSGKSTLLKMLAFIDKPGKGNILFKGESAEPFADHVRFQVTLLTQEPYLMKRSVFKNISYGLELRRDTHDLLNRTHSQHRCRQCSDNQGHCSYGTKQVGYNTGDCQP